jgi:two-component system sensor histidine kinase/response regulator
MQADKDKCLAVGMVDFISKPIEPDDLWRALRQWIKPRANQSDEPNHAPQAASAADGLPEIPSDIPGLDTALGLKRVLGKKQLYISMLRKFVASQSGVPAQIETALDVDDWNTAQRLAHTLKGVAGSIGAGALQAEAGKLEAAINDRQPRAAVEQWLSAPTRLLAEIVAALEAKLPPEFVAVATTVAVDPQRLKQVYEHLAALLANDNPESGEVLEANADLLRTVLGDGFRELARAIDDFDFEAALEALKKAAQNFNLAF